MCGVWGKAWVGLTQDGERLRDEVERIRHCARSDRLVRGGKPAIANVASEDL